MHRSLALVASVLATALVAGACSKASLPTAPTTPTPPSGVVVNSVIPSSDSSPEMGGEFVVFYTVSNAAAAVVVVRDDDVSGVAGCGSSRGVSQMRNGGSFSGSFWKRNHTFTVLLASTSVDVGCQSIERGDAWRSAPFKVEVARWQF